MFLEAFISVQKAAADKTGLLKKNPRAILWQPCWPVLSLGLVFY